MCALNAQGRDLELRKVRALGSNEFKDLDCCLAIVGMLFIYIYNIPTIARQQYIYYRGGTDRTSSPI